ncbi:hypothetical protein [Streptomyces sp. NPDC048106]|uniref:hypothetical protein n=1 Tax=Streptomyces sp. NPDC048106 TaxID=3155750 RepID=UPI0034531A30
MRRRVRRDGRRREREAAADGVTGRYFEDNQEARVVRGDEDRPGGVAAHALSPESADRLWEYASAALAKGSPRP